MYRVFKSKRAHISHFNSLMISLKRRGGGKTEAGAATATALSIWISVFRLGGREEFASVLSQNTTGKAFLFLRTGGGAWRWAEVYCGFLVIKS
jgi:hypothetical protein